jgi:hypothetical protein
MISLRAERHVCDNNVALQKYILELIRVVSSKCPFERLGRINAALGELRRRFMIVHQNYYSAFNRASSNPTQHGRLK